MIQIEQRPDLILDAVAIGEALDFADMRILANLQDTLIKILAQQDFRHFLGNSCFRRNQKKYGQEKQLNS